MTAGPDSPVPQERTVVEAFPDDDPLVYGELTAEQAALRMLLAVLAETGAVVVFPAGLAPSCVPLWVASGWRLEPTVIPPGPDVVAGLTARWAPPPAERFAALQPRQEAVQAAEEEEQ